MPRAFNRERSALGELLIRLRREHGHVSQAELARRTNGRVSAGHVAQIETGDRGASVETLAALGDALDATGRERLALLVAAGFRPLLNDDMSDEELDRLFEALPLSERAAALAEEALRLQNEQAEMRDRGATEDRLAAMELTLTEIRDEVARLAGHVARLMDTVGDEPPTAPSRRRARP